MNVIQLAVAQAVAARGYRTGWSKSEFVIRQVEKLIEEVAEIAGEVPLAPDLDVEIGVAGERARNIFTRQKPGFSPGEPDEEQVAAVQKELADLQVVIFCLADELGFDVQQAAFDKATKDIQRGVREYKERTE